MFNLYKDVVAADILANVLHSNLTTSIVSIYVTLIKTSTHLMHYVMYLYPHVDINSDNLKEVYCASYKSVVTKTDLRREIKIKPSLSFRYLPRLANLQ